MGNRPRPLFDSTQEIGSGAAGDRIRGHGIGALIERLFLVGGVILFILLVRRVGAETVLEDLLLIGWGFVLIIGQEILAYVANTLGWRQAFFPERPRILFRTLLAARIAGDAVNYVTPTAGVGGEFVRARMLLGQVDRTALWASVAVAKISQGVGQLLFILVGLLIVLPGTPLPAPVRQGLFVTLLVFAAASLAGVLLQRRGMFSVGVRLLRGLGLPISHRVGERLQTLDHHISRSYAAMSSFPLSVAYFFAGWAMGVVEIYITLYFLQIPVDWHLALAIEVLSATIDGVFFFVPAKAGTQEGGKMLIFTILGLDPAKGLALGIARRIRELSWSGVGLLILSRHQLRQRSRAH
jgi:uncharacterized membrane protein YbhN (UPF0104 family)